MSVSTDAPGFADKETLMDGVQRVSRPHWKMGLRRVHENVLDSCVKMMCLGAFWRCLEEDQLSPRDLVDCHSWNHRGHVTPVPPYVWLRA